MCTLAYCSKVEFSTSSPQGCAILTVSDKCEVHLLLKVWSAFLLCITDGLSRLRVFIVFLCPPQQIPK
jgi:hypothetical protein